MSDIFQLPVGGDETHAVTGFQQFGLDRNPFPPTGVDSGVFYNRHVSAELAQVNAWIVSSVKSSEQIGPMRPLAVFGSLGVGKTHLLTYLERGLSGTPKTPTLRKGLADEGMTRIVLANLFLRYLPFSDEKDADPGAGLLRRIVAFARASEANRKALGEAIAPTSPIRIPFFAAVNSQDDDALSWLSRWLRREYTTPAQRAKLGVSAMLDSEGQAIRAVADLMRLARGANLLTVWFVLIDQLEELWRPGVITASRRARLLTDLRLLVDLAFEGAPIAILLAWNTHIDTTSQVGERLEHDYRALWQRLETQVDLPALRPDDVWPFAQAYLRVMGVHETASAPQKRLFELLAASAPQVEQRCREAGPTGFAARKVMAAWRERADQLAETDTTVRQDGL